MPTPKPTTKTPKPGVYHNVPFDEYLAWDAMNKSGVGPITKSPAHYQEFLANPPSSEAMSLGSLTDTLVFEEGALFDRFQIRPDTYEADDGTTKPWRANANKCKETLAKLQASGKLVVSEGDYKAAVKLKEAVYAHRAAAEILGQGKPQVSILWVDRDTGVPCKARLDWVEPHVSIDDLKTTRTAGPDEFPRECAKYLYHVQGAVYTDGWETLTGERLPFIIIAVEKGDKPKVAVYKMDKISLEAGRGVYKRALYAYKACKASGVWPGYSEFVEPITMPTWVLRAELGDEVNTHEF